MNIEKFARRPELVKITLDSADILEAYGDPIIFWIWDSVNISTYFDFFKSQADNDGEQINVILRRLILNEQGQPCIADDSILPIDIALEALTKINERLGKSKIKPSIQEVGNQ